MEKTMKEAALEIASLIEDAKGEKICVIDISRLNSWTDFFVIATVASGQQSHGIDRKVREYAKANALSIFVPHQKRPDGDDWALIDLGGIVVHLMSQRARDFYDLEKLWHGGEFLRQPDAAHF